MSIKFLASVSVFVFLSQAFATLVEEASEQPKSRTELIQEFKMIAIEDLKKRFPVPQSNTDLSPFYTNFLKIILEEYNKLDIKPFFNEISDNDLEEILKVATSKEFRSFQGTYFDSIVDWKEHFFLIGKAQNNTRNPPATWVFKYYSQNARAAIEPEIAPLIADSDSQTRKKIKDDLLIALYEHCIDKEPEGFKIAEEFGNKYGEKYHMILQAIRKQAHESILPRAFDSTSHIARSVFNQ